VEQTDAEGEASGELQKRRRPHFFRGGRFDARRGGDPGLSLLAVDFGMRRGAYHEMQ
jgi:hypothetical protein